MKKKTLTLLAVIILAGAGILFMNACSKNENNVQTQKSYKYVEFMPSQEDVIPLIKDFNAVYKNYEQGLKSGTDYPLNEALWNLEAGVNYEYRSVKEGLANLMEDSTFVTIPVTVDDNGNYTINGDDLAIAYANLLNFTDVQLTMGGENKTLLVADVSIKDVTPQSATMKMTTSAATPSNPSCDIENDDYWYPTGGHGKCWNWIGQFLGEDASTRINFILNDCYDFDCETGIVFISNVITLNDVFDTEILWYGNFNECLYPNEMQNYLNAAWQVIDNNTPSQKEYISCYYTWTLFPNGGNNYMTHYFENIKYGRVVCIED